MKYRLRRGNCEELIRATMLVTRSRRGKEIAEEPGMYVTRSRRGKDIAEESTDREGVLTELPPRLFATDRFPSERVNMYSKIDYLLWVKNALGGSPAMKKLLGSCFGSLFHMPVQRLLMGKVVHSMMTRQVWTINDLKPAAKQMGVCENPEADFYAKLRQQTVKASGFPYASVYTWTLLYK